VFYGAQNIEKRYPIPFRWIERGSLRTAAGVYCCNHEAAAILRRKGLRGIDATIGLGLDVERFADRRVDADERGGFRLGYVGRIEHRKGVRVLIEALQDLHGIDLELHGDGPDRPAMESLVRQLGLEGSITFCGFSPEDELPSVYRRFDALAVPSLRTPDWVEQFGRVAVEAMAAGVPVLASDDGALRDVVGGAGVLVPPGDVIAWRKAMERVASDPLERARLRALGLERAQRYTWAAVADAHREFYDAVLR
jgi:glycosyltransferase involved in cell wall biosynthesis